MENQGIAKEEPSTEATPSMQTIQDWHVVLGDPHAAYRTTAATDLLRHVKQEFKQQFRGQASAQWISAAIKTFYQRLRVNFPSVVDDNDLGRVLIKCNAKTMASGRVLEPKLYRYASDTTATYGLAYQESSLNFFLQSRDAPTLAQELQKYQKLLQRWLVSSKRCRGRRRHQGELPSHQALRSFIQTLLFFQERLEASQRGDALAKALLQSLGVIPALRIQWSVLQEKIAADIYAINCIRVCDVFRC